MMMFDWRSLKIILKGKFVGGGGMGVILPSIAFKQES